jgi:hypothetical protein
VDYAPSADVFLVPCASPDGVRVFLIGHGYAPVFRITDGTGRVVFNGPVPFIAVEQAGLTSEGVIKVPDAHPRQLGFAHRMLAADVRELKDETLDAMVPGLDHTVWILLHGVAEHGTYHAGQIALLKRALEAERP